MNFPDGHDTLPTLTGSAIEEPRRRPDIVSENERRFAAGQMIGDRERQEDDYAALDLSGAGSERLLFVVADGMGGHKGAAAVTQLAVRRFCEIMKSHAGRLDQGLQQALTGANDAVARAAILDGALEGAGCAFLAAALENGVLSWISVGDCSLYLIRRGKLRKLNEDHSMRPVLEEMVAAGRLSARNAAREPRRHSLRSALKGSEIPLIDKSEHPLHLMPADTIILASDGFETLNNRAVIKLVRPGTAIVASKMVERLLAAVQSKRAHNQDNATVVYYNFEGRDHVLGENVIENVQWTWAWFVLVAAVLCAVGYGLYVSNH